MTCCSGKCIQLCVLRLRGGLMMQRMEMGLNWGKGEKKGDLDEEVIGRAKTKCLPKMNLKVETLD